MNEGEEAFFDILFAGGLASVDWDVEPFDVLRHAKVNWAGREEGVRALLEVRNVELTLAVLDVVRRPAMSDDEGIQSVELLDVEGWIRWVLAQSDADRWWWLASEAGRFLAVDCTPVVQRQCVRLFVQVAELRPYLFTYVLPLISGIGIKDFNPASIEWMISFAQTAPIHAWDRQLLVEIANEDFVVERLLPALQSAADGRARENLIQLLEKLSSAHRRRYIDETGVVLSHD